MDKYFYKSVVVVFFLGLVFSGCKKDDKNVGVPGLSYGITGIEPMSAGTGDTVKVYGVGFDGNVTGNEVTIGNAKAKVIAASSTQLSVIVPGATRLGNVAVTTGSKSYTFNQQFNVVTVLSGNLHGNVILNPGQLYLLKGDVHVIKGATMTIEAGTALLADKLSIASLTVDDGATITANGTVDKPVVFTSAEAIGQRAPGDWKGIILAASTSANDKLQYVRIEFAGFHLPNVAGAALLINRNTANDNIKYIEASYSGGDGFRCAPAANTQNYLKYLMAFGCAGNDFDFAGKARVIGQFLVGLKDPKLADQYGSDGLLVQSSQTATISNLTLVGPNGLSRNATNTTNPYYYGIYDDVLNSYAGRGVHIGGYVNGQAVSGKLQLFNSVVAAPWLAGISVDGPESWKNYGSTSGSIVKYTSITYNEATSQTTQYHENPPGRGYSFSGENLKAATSGFTSSANTPQGLSYSNYNDTLKLRLFTPFINSPTPYDKPDELGIANMVIYTKITNPLMTPSPESVLQNSAVFNDAELNDSAFDKSHKFRGAFGIADWTKGWSNYVPQQTSYN